MQHVRCSNQADSRPSSTTLRHLFLTGSLSSFQKPTPKKHPEQHHVSAHKHLSTGARSGARAMRWVVHAKYTHRQQEETKWTMRSGAIQLAAYWLLGVHMMTQEALLPAALQKLGTTIRNRPFGTDAVVLGNVNIDQPPAQACDPYRLIRKRH